MTEENNHSTVNGKTNELMVPAYWIGHILMVIATVLGVYLAATVGFEKAIKFELARSERNKYYLISALQTEVQDNIVILEEFMKEYENKHYDPKLQKPNLSKLIWDGMKYTPNKHEVPFALLSDINEYYRNVDKRIKFLEANGARYRNNSFKKLLEDNRIFEAEVMPEIEKYRNDQKKLLLEYAIKI